MAVQGWAPQRALAEAKKYGLQIDQQMDFILDFGAKLKAGEVTGYPLVG